MSAIIGGMILLSVISGCIGGRVAQVSEAAMTGCGEAVQLVIALAGTLCLWSGVMRIADKSGITAGLSCVLQPITKVLFREIHPQSAAMKAICMNMAANLLGLGNAATPFGIAAMKELEKENLRNPAEASPSMITFVVLNTASLQLIPTTNAFLRLMAGSQRPMEILPAVWITSFCSITVAVVLSKVLWGRRKLGAKLY